MIFLVGILWLVFGGGLARRLSNFYTTFTLSGQAFREYQRTGSKKALAGAVVAGVTLDRFVASVAINNLPFPLNYLYWMGMWPIIPFLIFGLLPSLFTWTSIGSLVGLASVMDAGGDGTEYVEAKRIHWFYSLSPVDRERVREGSDLEDGEEESDDESDDEERGLTKKGHHREVSAQ
jgi:hypothetical protein